MRFSFYRPENVNLYEFYNIIGKLEYDLEKLTKKKAKKNEIRHYVENLCREAKPLKKNPEMCFWGMAEPGTMPSDSRVEFFYRPSYLATAFLMQAILQYPELESGDAVEGSSSKKCSELLKDILPKAMRGCTGRGFAGSGYRDIIGQLDTMELFLANGAVDFLAKYPDICPEFTELFHNILDMYRENIKEGKNFDAWGDDYSDRMKQVLSMAGESDDKCR